MCLTRASTTTNRGKQLFVRSTFESLRDSLIEFGLALEIGPDYVLANIALARSHSMLAETGATASASRTECGTAAVDELTVGRPRT